MVVGAFPLAKLGILLVRQVSKPIAGYIKAGAKRSNAFRNYVCLPTAHFYHWAETRWKLYVMGLGMSKQAVTPMSEQMAVELGADILGELFIFTVAAGLLTAEYVRSSANSRAKEEAQERRLQSMETRIVELDLLIEQQRAQLREQERNMFSSPLRALKEKLTGTESTKNDQKGVSTITAPPGPESAKNSQQGPPKTTTGSEASKNGSPSSGTVSDVDSVGLAHSAASDNSEISPAHDDRLFTPKMVRRALKIVFDAYEEAFDED